MTDIATATLPEAASLSDTFNPPSWLANAHLQSILPSLKLRRPFLMRRARNVVSCAQEHILDCGDGVRLMGLYSSQQSAGRAPSKELVVLLHGWEGSSDSLYVLSLGSHLFNLGCDIFRLNFRDHGPTHHLNQDIFHSCRLDEVIGAVKSIQRQYPNHRLTIAGFSLGGNFALRVAARAPAAGIRLERAVGVCPVLRPHSAMEILERGPFFYQRYFIGKWKRSLRIKQTLFPKVFDFAAVLAEKSIRKMTELMIKQYSDFGSLDAYLEGYAITGNVLTDLQVPSHIVCSLDDPIIPSTDLDDLPRQPNLHVHAVPHGGHCGFMDRFNSESWADRKVARLMGLSIA
ncbi:MAG: YheT family hydrolase [Povalibacter sp.]